jgi:hypothetical protein
MRTCPTSSESHVAPLACRAGQRGLCLEALNGCSVPNGLESFVAVEETQAIDGGCIAIFVVVTQLQFVTRLVFFPRPQGVPRL